MKRFITSIVAFLLIMIMSFSSYSVNAQTCNAPAMTWKNPVLISGAALQKDAVYKFNSVTAGVYAKVTIRDIKNGAKLISLDDTRYGYNAAWQPIVRTPSAQVASDSYINFKIEFFDSVDDKAHKYDCFQLSFIDIDGDNEHVREFVAAKDFDSYAIANNTQLTISNPGSGMTQATGSLQDYAGLDTGAYRTNINYSYTDKDKVNEVWVGTRVDATHDVRDRYSCGYFAQITMPYGPLPLKFLSFDGVVDDNIVNLNWVTTQEVNTSHFEVERAFEINDFSPIGTVLDGFASGYNKIYKFKDATPELKGRTMVYYRLKQFDIDGVYAYSKVIAVRLQAKTDVKMEVSPNPFVENVNLRFTAVENGVAQIRILSITGQTMLSKQSIISKGYNNLQVNDIRDLAKGMYVVQLIMNGTIIDNQRIIKN